MVLAIYLFKYDPFLRMNLTEDRICVCGGRM